MGDNSSRNNDRSEKASKKAGEKVKKASKRIKEEIDKVDLEKEALNLMNFTEKSLDGLSDTVKKKRAQMETDGVGNTIKRDSEEALDTARRTTADVIDEMEILLAKLKMRVRKD